MLNYYQVSAASFAACASLTQLLGCAKARQIAFVGSGGKTTLLYALASELAQQGRRVVVTTTTKIYQPPTVWTDSLAVAERLIEPYRVVTVGRICEGIKLAFLGEAAFAKLQKLADVVLVEADGSRGLPLKAPAAHEPVVMIDTDITVGVIGIDALERPFSEVCHRAELACAILGRKVSDRVSAADAAQLLTSADGIKKNCRGQWQIIINKVNTAAAMAKAQQICAYLGQTAGAAGWYDGR